MTINLFDVGGAAATGIFVALASHGVYMGLAVGFGVWTIAHAITRVAVILKKQR